MKGTGGRGKMQSNEDNTDRNSGSATALNSSKREPEAGCSRNVHIQNPEDLSNDKNEIKDSTQLLAIFPEEIWMMISEKMTSPNDMERFSNASPYFRHLLLNIRVLFLFPKVFSILALMYHFHQARHKMASSNEDEEEDIFTRLYKNCDNLSWIFYDDEELEATGISGNDSIACRGCRRPRSIKWYSKILKLRLVCTDWCAGVDGFYDDYIAKECYMTDDHINNYDWVSSNFRMSFDPNEDDDDNEDCTCVRNFLDHFRETHEGTERSPFLLRKVAICFDVNFNDINREPFMIDVASLLQKYGRHIWHFDVHFMEDAIKDLPESYLKLKKILDLLPNLKSLGVTAEPYNEHRLTTIKRVLRSNQLLPLQSVQALRLSNLNTLVVNEIVQKTNHVSSLIAVRDETCSVQGLFTPALPNLKELKTELFSKEDFIKLNNSRSKWPLDSLTFFESETKDFITWPRVFSVLENKFSETLTVLDIAMPTKQNRFGGTDVVLEDCASYRLNMPQLKKLTVDMNNFSSVDFLLPLANLETLDVSCYYNRKSRDHKKILYDLVRNGQVIQYVGWEGQMEKSNIWEHLPKLKVIRSRTLGHVGGEQTLISKCKRRVDWKKANNVKSKARK